MRKSVPGKLYVVGPAVDDDTVTDSSCVDWAYVICTLYKSPFCQLNVPCVMIEPAAAGTPLPIINPRDACCVEEKVSNRMATPFLIPAMNWPNEFVPFAKPMAPPIAPVAVGPRGSRCTTNARPSEMAPALPAVT